MSAWRVLSVRAGALPKLGRGKLTFVDDFCVFKEHQHQAAILGHTPIVHMRGGNEPEAPSPVPSPLPRGGSLFVSDISGMTRPRIEALHTLLQRSTRNGARVAMFDAHEMLMPEIIFAASCRHGVFRASDVHARATPYFPIHWDLWTRLADVMQQYQHKPVTSETLLQQLTQEEVYRAIRLKYLVRVQDVDLFRMPHLPDTCDAE